MKKYSSILFIAMLVVVWVACEKNTYNVTERTEVTDMALIKIGYFAPSITHQPVQAKLNGVRVSPTMAYNTPFPGGGLNTGGSNNSDYLVLAPGNNTLQLSVAKVNTDVDSIKVFENQFNFADKRQIVFITDSFPNVAGVLVDVETPAPADATKSRIKFIHLIPNVAAVDFYRGTELLKANVPYKGETEFFDVAAGAANYVIKEAGQSGTLGTQSITPAAGRIYTFFSRGFKGGAGLLNPRVSAMIVQ